MGKTPCIPSVLKLRPFSLAEARDAGLTLSALAGKSWHRLDAQLYRWANLPEDPLMTLLAWQRMLPPETVFVGASAAWLLGLDLEPTNPVEVAVPKRYGHRSRAGLLVRRDKIPSSEVVIRRGVRTTAMPRTLLRLCMQRPPVEALVAIDMGENASPTRSRCADTHGVNLALRDSACLRHWLLRLSRQWRRGFAGC